MLSFPYMPTIESVSIVGIYGSIKQFKQSTITMQLNKQVQSILPDNFRVIIREEDFGLPESYYMFHKHITVSIIASVGNFIFFTSGDNFTLSSASINKIKAFIDKGVVNTVLVKSQKLYGSLKSETDPFVDWFQGPEVYEFYYDPLNESIVNC